MRKFLRIHKYAIHLLKFINKTLKKGLHTSEISPSSSPSSILSYKNAMRINVTQIYMIHLQIHAVYLKMNKI